jgi:hypothetical protein
MKKIKVRKNLSDHLYELEGSLDKAIEYLKDLKGKYSQYENLHFDVDYDWDSKQLYLWGEIDETDAEYEARLGREKIVQDQNDKRDREHYERLKAKFENEKE